jgi:hypothetical protein
MAVERFVTPARYIAGKTNRATLVVRYRDINGKRRSVTVKGVGSYRLREDGSRFSVRASEGAGVKNDCVIAYGTGNSGTIRTGGNALIACDITLTLKESGYPVIVA